MSTDTDSAARGSRQQLQQELLRRARAGTARRATAGAEPISGAGTGQDGHASQTESAPSPAPSAACG